MTRLLCFGDLHLGAGKDFGTPEHSRLDDQRQTLGHILETFLERGCDAFLFAGDVTHHRSAVEEIAAFQEFLSDKQALRLVGIPGNHDRSTMGVASTLEVAAGGAFGYDTTIIPRPWLVALEGVTIACLPWCPTSAIAAMDPTGQVDDVSRTAVEILMDVARGLLAESLERFPNYPCVLLGHWSAAGAVTPTGALVDEFREPVLPTSELATMGFAAVVLGHIHTAGPLAGSPAPVLYTGSPCVVDFGEADTRHGVWIIDTDRLDPTKGDPMDGVEFVPIPDRAFVTVGKDDILSPGSLDGAIVRVRYEATADEERLIDHETMKANVYAAGAHRVYAIQADIQRGDGARTAVTEDLDVDDALALWLEGQEEPFDPRVLAVHHEIREAVR